MPKVSQEVLAAVRKALGQWEEEVRDSNLAPKAKNTYLLHPNNFVRWLDDDFKPGARLR